MFENLDDIRPELGPILSELRPLSVDKVESIRRKHPRLPEEYFRFLLERGAGPLIEGGEFFRLPECPVSAISEYYMDDEIIKDGASGDILIFGWELTGEAYGFDTGADYRISRSDSYRSVLPLDIDFYNFIRGILVCYPHTPHKFDSDVWYDGVGRAHKIGYIGNGDTHSFPP